MITRTSPSASHMQRSARGAAHACLTTYPPQRMPAILQVIGAEVSVYDRNTAYGVALNFEYPVIPKCPLKKEAQAQ